MTLSKITAKFFLVCSVLTFFGVSLVDAPTCDPNTTPRQLVVISLMVGCWIVGFALSLSVLLDEPPAPPAS